MGLVKKGESSPKTKLHSHQKQRAGSGLACSKTLRNRKDQNKTDDDSQERIDVMLGRQDNN